MNPYGLSERELEVLRLAVAGYTDRQMANGLFVSVMTVASHMAHIAAKMGGAGRDEAVQRAKDEGRRW